MTKYLNFSITEETGRTFELPMEEAAKIVNQIKENDEYVKDVKVDVTDGHSIAKFLVWYGYLDEVARYEIDNDYIEQLLCDTKVFEKGEGV